MPNTGRNTIFDVRTPISRVFPVPLSGVHPSVRSHPVLALIRVSVFLWLILNVTPDALAQETGADHTIAILRRAMIKGDAKALVSVASEGVDLAFDGESRTYSRSHARRVLKKYFSKHRFRSFSVIDFTKTSRGWFLEGRLGAREHRPVRIYIRLIRSERGWILRELLFESKGIDR